MGFPSGPIGIQGAYTKDESTGRDWNMPDAKRIRFLAVSGTIWIGDCQLYYEFTLVEYHLYIDEVPWLIFSTLNDALTQEFTPDFFKTLNCNRKERWGFLDVTWLEDKAGYEVAEPYVNVRLSIFNTYAHSVRVVRPFVWQNNHLRVHPNGAAVFAEDKKLAFLLPLIIDAHQLLPPTPIFWERDDKTIPLARTTMWLNDQTIQWLAETGESYPYELRSDIQPRLDEIKNSRQVRKQPPPPPKPNRWQEKPKEKQAEQGPQEPSLHAAQASQPSPRQLVDKEKQYMKLQAAFARIAQTAATASKPALQPPQDSTEPTSLNRPTTEEDKNTPQPAKSQPADPTGQSQQGSQQPSIVPAQELADQRPAPPPPISVPKPKMDAPGTGELSNQYPEHKEAQPQPPVQHCTRQEVAGNTSPEDSPTESSDMMETGPVSVSSPEVTQEPAHEATLASADIHTLRIMQKEAQEKVTTLASELTMAQGHLRSINKRLKTMQSDQEVDTPSVSPPDDVQMELVD